MSRLVAAALPNEDVDHKDRNTLNNQRETLRIATPPQNGANIKLNAKNTSGFKGVCWLRKNNRWQANIRVIDENGQRLRKTLGRFTDIKDAARAYDSALIKYKGAFALTNAALGLL